MAVAIEYHCRFGQCGNSSRTKTKIDGAISDFQEVGDNIDDMDIDCYNNSESESEESGSDVNKEELAEEIREVDEYHFSKVYDASNLIDQDLLIRRKIPDSRFPLCNASS